MAPELVELIEPEQLAMNVAPHLKIVTVAEPAGYKAGIEVADVAPMVDMLKYEAKVI